LALDTLKKPETARRVLYVVKKHIKSIVAADPVGFGGHENQDITTEFGLRCLKSLEVISKEIRSALGHMFAYSVTFTIEAITMAFTGGIYYFNIENSFHMLDGFSRNNFIVSCPNDGHGS